MIFDAATIGTVISSVLGSSGLAAWITHRTTLNRIASRDRKDDRSAFERAYESKSAEHADCVARVDALHAQVLELSTDLARCEERHEAVEERLTALERQRDTPPYGGRRPA